MGTTPARKFSANVVHAIRGRVTFSDTNVATGIQIGTIPAASFVKECKVNIETAFNAATTNVLVVGSSADDDGFLTSATAAAGSTGFKSGTGAQSGNVTADTPVYVKYTQTGTAATTGVADVLLEFYPHAS